MTEIPRDFWPDSTLAFKREGYEFISKRCARLRTNIFKSRLLLEKTIFLKGAEAAELFYRNDRFERQGAMPTRVTETLTGKTGVQSLDGEAHRNRKRMLMQLMTPERLGALKKRVADEFNTALDRWREQPRIQLFGEINQVLMRAVCGWAEVPLPERDVARRTAEMEAMIDSPATIGRRHREGKEARGRAEAWLADFIDHVREGRHFLTDTHSAAHSLISFRDHRNELIPASVLAVDLLNILRPTVAIGRYITFMALALHRYPEERARLFTGGEFARTCFVQEVRRFYPFFPAVAAKVKQDFTWNDYAFAKGEKVVLDLYGTNHDPQLWDEPEIFFPDRFRYWDGSPFDFIPQGGGTYERHHRCAGEWLTVDLMKVVLYLLTHTMTYQVPKQNLSVNLAQVPALPKSGFVMSHIARRRQLPQSSNSAAFAVG